MSNVSGICSSVPMVQSRQEQEPVADFYIKKNHKYIIFIDIKIIWL